MPLQEIDQLCAEWEPQPLVPQLSEEEQLPEPPVIERCVFDVRTCVCGACLPGSAQGTHASRRAERLC
jgi:hypothetical protein